MRWFSIPRLFLLTTLSVLLVCQLSSYLIETTMPLSRSIDVIGILKFTHVRNDGGIFGIFQGKGYLFGAVALLFLGLLSWFVARSQDMSRLEYLCFGLVVGGGLSNVMDRLIYGSVIDFIDLRGIPHWKYIFNTADVCIHLGVWPMIIYGLFFHKPAREEKQPLTAPNE